MNKKRLTTIINIIIIVFFLVTTTGCNMTDSKDKKIEDIQYQIIEESDVPDPLIKYINDKKEIPFKLSYANENELYIVIGYGKQVSSGYSITVDELYTTKDSIIVKTSLVGPSEEEVNEIVTYPYIVIKMEFIDKEVKL